VVTDSWHAHGRVLSRSIRAHNDGTRVHVYSLDSDLANAFGLAEEELLRMAAMYDPTALAGALKPRVMRQAFEEGAETVIWLDSDVEVYASLEPAARLAREQGLVLTPHMTAPARHLEPWLLRAGSINGGFVAAAAAARPFLEWWASRTARFSIHAVEQGYLYEQRWLDLAPALFAAQILRHPGYNVMGWNLHERRIRLEPRPTVNGEPLVFFHFCGGFDPRQPERLATMPGLPWDDASEHDGVQELCRAYASQLLAAGYRAVRTSPYRYGTTSEGEAIDSTMRAAYRRALLEAEKRDDADPPNPFVNGRAFMRWLCEPVDERGVTRYLETFHARRLDLRYAFPQVPGGDSRRYLDWVRAEPANAQTIPARFRPV
jgi:hypothetical protein